MTSAIYTAKDVVMAKFDSFVELTTYEYNHQDILDYLKQCCDEYKLDVNVVKELFDEYEWPLSYDIDKDEIIGEPVLESNNDPENDA